MSKIHTKTVWEWSNEQGRYVKIYDEYLDYEGPIALACGSTAAQNQIQSSQISFMNQLQSQAATVFGNASQVFSGLMSTFAPIVAAGPNQQGFSPALLSSLNSQAITETGQAYKNAKAAVGDQEAAVGGGNLALPSGAEIGSADYLASQAANQTSSELQQITQENYATGRQNYEQAVAGEEGATNVFGAAAGAGNAATNAGNAASNTANSIAQENNSWISAVTGLAGSLGGAFLGGFGKGLGNQGGSNTNNSGV